MADDTNTAERDALMDLIDAYAEARHVGGCHTYNAKTAEARAKVVASLAASAGSEPVAWRWKPSDVFDEWVTSDDSSKIHAAIVSGRDVFPLYTHPSPPEGMAGWRPIETAPKDGGEILLRSARGRIADGAWGQPDGWANPNCWVWPYINQEPTHWMPLPKAPAPPASEAKEL